MARKSGANDLVMLGIIGFVLYQAALSGALGARAKEVAGNLPGSLGLGGGGAGTGGGGAGGGPGSGGGAGGTGGPPPGGYGDMAAMAAANPNIYQQMMDWQRARRANAENPTDWEAFRRHEVAIGAPDPGPRPPQLFVSGAYL